MAVIKKQEKFKFRKSPNCGFFSTKKVKHWKNLYKRFSAKTKKLGWPSIYPGSGKIGNSLNILWSETGEEERDVQRTVREPRDVYYEDHLTGGLQCKEIKS